MNKKYQAAIKLHSSGYIKEALSQYLTILETEEHKDPDALNNAAACLLVIGWPVLATKLLLSSLRLRHGFQEANNNLANALRDQGILNDAMIFYKRAIATKPEDQLTVSNLKLCEMYLNQPPIQEDV